MKRKTTLPLFVACLIFAMTATARAREQAYMGVLLGPVPEVLSAYGVKEGAMVHDVAPGSPAAKAGLRTHDIIVSAGSVTIQSPEDVTKTVRAAKPGEVLSFELRRGDEPIKMDLTLGSAPAAPWSTQVTPEPPAAPEPEDRREKGFLGVGYTRVPPLLAYHLGTKPHTGVVVGDVWKDSPAEAAGIRRNDILISIDGETIAGTDNFVQALARKKAGDPVKIELIQKGEKITADITLATQPKELSLGREPSFGAPGVSRGGKLSFKGPNGHQFTYKFPKGAWDLDSIVRDFDTQLQDLEAQQGKGLDYDQLSTRLKSFIEGRFHPPGAASSWPPREGSSATVRIHDGVYEITVVDNNGARTISVRKGDDVLAKNLPYAEIKSLPEEVQGRVENAAKQLRSAPATKRSLSVKSGIRT